MIRTLMTAQAHVHGKDPLGEKGQYFVVGPWSWQVLLTLISIADMRRGGRLISDDQFAALSFSTGPGIEDKVTCNVLADELEAMMRKPAICAEHGLEISDDAGEVKLHFTAKIFGMLVDDEGRLYSSARVTPENTARLKLRSAHSISRTEVLEFVGFLRSCNGFSLT